MHFHFYEFHHTVGSLVCGVTTKLSILNTNELRSAVKKITDCETSLGSDKSLPITNSLLNSDQLITQYHWRLKITISLFKITVNENELSLFHG